MLSTGLHFASESTNVLNRRLPFAARPEANIGFAAEPTEPRRPVT